MNGACLTRCRSCDGRLGGWRKKDLVGRLEDIVVTEGDGEYP